MAVGEDDQVIKQVEDVRSWLKNKRRKKTLISTSSLLTSSHPLLTTPPHFPSLFSLFRAYLMNTHDDASLLLSMSEVVQCMQERRCTVTIKSTCWLNYYINFEERERGEEVEGGGGGERGSGKGEGRYLI